LQYLIESKTCTFRVKFSLVIVCIGVAVATVTDLNFNFFGSLVALAGTIVTSYYYILIGERQRTLKMNAQQVLYLKAPLAVIGLAILVPILDDFSALQSFVWTQQCVRDIILSCCVALLLNISAFETVGKTSALSFAVVGHLKTVGVFVFGFIIFSASISLRTFSGLLVTAFGIGYYSYLKATNQ
jgi:solute carrier family 35 protein E3